MTTRAKLADAVRPLAPGGKLLERHMPAFNALADALGLPGDGARPAPEPSASLVGIPADYWGMLSKIESGDRPYIKASTSTGSGLYQFLRSTWIGEGGAWGTETAKAFGGLMPTPAEQLARVKTLTAKNAAALRRLGVPINKASLYAAHFFGAGMAARVIAADPAARADAIAGDAATKANPSILKGKTVGQFLAWLHAKTGDWAR